MLRAKVFIIVLFASLIIIATALADTQPPVSAEIEILEVNENDRISIRLKFTLKNEFEKDIEILKWGTPFEGEFTSDCFDVRYNDERVQYLGILVKRGAPQVKDFVKIAANAELSEIVYLDDGYQIYKGGLYTVQYIESSMTIKVPSLGKNIGALKSLPTFTKLPPVHSNQAEFVLLEGFNEPTVLDQPPDPSYCSAPSVPDNVGKIFSSAHKAAINIALTAKQSLQDAPMADRPQAERYFEWFGSHTESRYATVTTNFDRIYNVLTQTQGGTLAFCCSVRDVYAYVYPSRPYYIYFGRQFWPAPLTGTDSQAGTFIHEISHFNVVAGTKDHVYGQPDARHLARNIPVLAINNADNYEYFAETYLIYRCQLLPIIQEVGAGADVFYNHWGIRRGARHYGWS